MLFFLVFVLLFDSIRLSTVQTQLSASRDAAVRPEFFEERALKRERERDRTRCRWEETALTLERGSVRTEARARSFAYLLPTLPEYVQLSSVPFNLSTANAASHDRSTRRKPLSLSLSRAQRKGRKEGREKGEERCAVSIRTQYSCGGKGRSSRFSMLFFHGHGSDGRMAVAFYLSRKGEKAAE